MRVRHKQPSLVSMWMLDVFCCALGCVTLLFLLNSRMASDEAKANKTALIDLNTTERKLAASLDELNESRLKLNSAEAGREKLAAALSDAEGLNLRLSTEATQLATQLATTRTEKDDLAKKLALARMETTATQQLADATQRALNAAEAKVEANATELAMVRKLAQDADDVLRKKQKESESLTTKLTESTTKAEDLARLLRKRDDEKIALAKEISRMRSELDDLDAKVLATRKELDAASMAAKQAAAELATAKAKSGEDVASAATRMKDLLKKVDDANAMIIDLQGDKAKLADKYDRLQKDTEARFAGIVTSGKHVVFLVDMSGSMAKKDTETADATKWAIVVDTVTKVMRSVAGMEKYQVIIFSSSAKWLFGGSAWRTFNGEESVKEVKDALLEVRPFDDTNLYMGLEKAFSLRDTERLDTIYLFSDGLPTSGPGLSVAQQSARPPLKEIERSEILGRHIRTTLNEQWNRPLAGRTKVKIHSIGFYFDSPDLGAFLWALARENDGSFVGMSRP